MKPSQSRNAKASSFTERLQCAESLARKPGERMSRRDLHDCAPCKARMLAKMKAAMQPRPLISVCINTHNEGPRVGVTVRAFRENLADWPHEFIVVADEVTDGGCDDLGPGVTVIRNPKRRGCGRCKLQAIEAARGDVLLFLDAHQNVIAGKVADMAVRAWREEAVFTPVIRNITYDDHWSPRPVNDHNQVPCAEALRFEKHQYRVCSDDWVRAHHLDDLRMVGVGFAISRRTLARLGGFNAYLGLHGSQERGIALRACMVGVPIRLDGTVILGHEFRAGKPRPRGYKRYTVRDQAMNFWHAYFVVSGDEAFEHIRPVLRRKAPAGAAVIERPEVRAERDRFLREYRRRSDTELLALVGLSAPSVPACRKSGPKIDVRIAYEPGGRIGQDYNRIMRETAHEWVLFLDHDVLLLHPSWYEVCRRAILEHPDGGLFTCFTNNIACKHQKAPDAPVGHDLARHRAYARAIWERYGYACTENRRWLIGGFFMLTSKTAWRKAGGFPEDGFFGVDNEYHRRILRAGFKCYRMDGLYCYHIRDRKDRNWIEGVDTAAVLARNRSHSDLVRSRAPVLRGARCVYTVITDGYDDLPSRPAAPGWDFLAFTTDPALRSESWKVLPFDPGDLDPRRASRLPKILPHRFLADYDYSIYLDANMRLRCTPDRLVVRAGGPDFAAVRHPFRRCVYDELRVIAKLGKAPAGAVETDVARYRAEGVPRNIGLYEAGLLLRRHNAPAVREIAETWWAEYERTETGRDQPALAVALWRLGRTIATLSATERARHISIIPHVVRAV